MGIVLNIHPIIVTFLGILLNIYPKIVILLGIMLYLTMGIEYNTRKNQIFEHDTHIMLNMPNTH